MGSRLAASLSEVNGSSRRGKLNPRDRQLSSIFSIDCSMIRRRARKEEIVEEDISGDAESRSHLERRQNQVHNWNASDEHHLKLLIQGIHV